LPATTAIEGTLRSSKSINRRDHIALSIIADIAGEGAAARIAAIAPPLKQHTLKSAQNFIGADRGNCGQKNLSDIL